MLGVSGKMVLKARGIPMGTDTGTSAGVAAPVHGPHRRVENLYPHRSGAGLQGSPTQLTYYTMRSIYLRKEPRLEQFVQNSHLPKFELMFAKHEQKLYNVMEYLHSTRNYPRNATVGQKHSMVYGKTVSVRDSLKQYLNKQLPTYSINPSCSYKTADITN